MYKTVSRTLLIANGVSGSSNVSGAIPINNASKITLSGYALGTGLSGKGGSLSVEVLTTDGNTAGTWSTYNKLIDNLTNSNSQNVTRVSAVLLASSANSVVTLDPTDAFTHFRTTITVAAKGTYYLFAQIQE